MPELKLCFTICCSLECPFACAECQASQNKNSGRPRRQLNTDVIDGRCCNDRSVLSLAMARDRLWNANIHYHSVLLKAIPKTAQRVLDVGCGDGILAAQLLRAGVRHVVALDADAGVLARARARHPGVPIEWKCGDILDLHPISHCSFDAVLSVATLHHMDAIAGLTRFAELVRPGGVVGVIGLAANDWWDWLYAMVGLCARVVVGMIRGYWEHSAPMTWPPPTTYREIKRIARDILPGVQYRHHFYGRYSLVWTRPGGAQQL